MKIYAGIQIKVPVNRYEFLKTVIACTFNGDEF